MQEVITFLPNLLPAQQSPWAALLQKGIEFAGALASAKVAKMGKPGNASSGDGDSGGSSSGQLIRFAWGRGYDVGGLVRGPGTDTSDSVPAMLSDGEFVMRAVAVRNIGADLLAWINNMGRLPALHLAGGGFVDVDTLSTMNDKMSLPAAMRDGGGDTHLHMHGTYQVQGGRLTKASETAIERDAARLAGRGLKRTIASRKE
jgi:hypothetical protein